MKKLHVAFAITLLACVPKTARAEDCEEISYETRQVEVLVECVQVVPVTNCVEEAVTFSIPIDSTAEPGDKPAPDGAEPTEKECKEPETETVQTTVLVQCTDLVIRTTLEPQLVSYQHPIDSPACEQGTRRPRILNRPRTGSLPAPVPAAVSVGVEMPIPTYTGTIIEAPVCSPCQPANQGCQRCGLFH